MFSTFHKKGFYLPMTGGKRGTGVTQSSASSLALLAISSCCSLRPWSSSSSSSATLFSRNFDNADNSSFKPLVLKWKEGWGRFQIRQYKVYKIIWKGNINAQRKMICIFRQLQGKGMSVVKIITHISKFISTHILKFISIHILSPACFCSSALQP